jgi:type II secretory pathway pseudopilin PulG
MISSKQNRSGFAMITAIIVVIIIGGLMAFSLSLVAQTGKRTTDLYLYEQAVLYSKSASELALLDIAQGGACTTVFPSLNSIPAIYDVNLTVKYVYYDDPLTVGINESPCGTIVVNTPEQNGSVLMDITVTTNEGTEPIRYFRRVMQKL